MREFGRCFKGEIQPQRRRLGVPSVKFFCICDLDEEAVKKIEAYLACKKGRQNPIEYRDIKRSVRLLQAYEDMFLDSVYD